MRKAGNIFEFIPTLNMKECCCGVLTKDFNVSYKAS